MLRLLIVFVMVGLVAAFTWLLTALGLSQYYALAGAGFLTGVVLLYTGRVIDISSVSDVNLLYVFGGITLAFPPAALATAWGEAGYHQHGLLRYLLGAVIELVLLALIALAVTAVLTWVVRSRRKRQRQRLAAEQGWRYADTDAAVVGQLGERLHYLLTNSQFDPKVEPGTRSHAVLYGQSNGVGFVAFDFSRPRRWVPAERGTAVVVGLPGDVPLFASGNVFTWYWPKEYPGGVEDPVLTQLVATSDVAEITVRALRSWWFGGRVLVAISGSVERGADDKRLLADITAVTYLARLLNWDAISRHQPAVRPG